MTLVMICIGLPLTATGAGLIWLGTRFRNGGKRLLGRVDKAVSKWDAAASDAWK